MELEYQLSNLERAFLAATFPTDGFKVIQKICEGECHKFITALLNTDAGKDAEVLAAHKMAKAAAQVYAGIASRIQHEVTVHNNTPREGDKPIDPTEGSLDLGEIMEDNPELNLGGYE